MKNLPKENKTSLKELILEYKKRKHVIKERLNSFKNIHKSHDNNIFYELCFCLLTPQSKAVHCDKAIKELRETNYIFKGNKYKIRKKLTMIRFPNNKTRFIVQARHIFKNGKCLDIKSKINPDNILETREWLVKNINGLGFKEASHFLRNIGLGKDLAILDIHILRNLKEFGIIDIIPKTINKKNYLTIESKLKLFSKRIKIPMGELDLLFWAKETGFVFK